MVDDDRMILDDPGVWHWDEMDGNSIVLTGYIGEDILDRDIVIPAALCGHNVAGLGRKIFYKYKMITGVQLPDSITSAGDAAFCICNSLERFGFSRGMEEIPPDFFNECGFRELDMPEWIKHIRRGAFINNRELERVELPDGLEEIELMTFSGCSSLKAVSLPSKLKTIGTGAFSGCRSLEEIELPEGLESIGDMAFLSCTALRKVRLPGSVKSVGDMAFPEDTKIIRG